MMANAGMASDRQHPRLVRGALVGVLFVVSLFLTVAIFAPQSTSAATGIEQEMSFEGKIVNSTGQNIADGTYNMEFKIYTGCTNEPTNNTGCTLTWTEDHLVSASDGVNFTSGTYQVNLGQFCPLSGGACTPSGANDGNTNTAINWNSYPLYVSLQIGNTSSCSPTSNGFTSTCGGDGEMSPYILLTSTPYAFNAGELGGLTASQFGQLTASNTWSGANVIQDTSTTAFEVQNTGGSTTLLDADTTDNCVGIRGTCSGNASGAYIPWVSGDSNTTVVIGSTSASDNQVAVLGESYSNVGVKGTANSGIGTYGYSNTYVGVYGQSQSGTSGLFQANAATNTTPTLVSEQQGAGTADLFQAQNNSGGELDNITSNGNVGIGKLNTNSSNIALNVAGLVQQSGLQTTYTSSTYNGQWTELGACTITSQYTGCATQLNIMGGNNGTSTDNSQTVVSFRVYQQNAMGGIPYVIVNVGDNTEGITPSSIIAVTTTNSGTQTIVQLWAQVNKNYETWNYAPVEAEGGLSWTPLSGFQTTLPAGTQTYSTFNDVTGSTVTTGNSAIASSVQEWDGHATGDASLTVSPHTTGNLMTFAVNVPSYIVQVQSLSGGGVSNWHFVTDYTDNTGPGHVEIWEGTVTSTGSSAISVTYNYTPTGNVELAAQEFTAGLGASTNWSVTASNTNDTTTSSTTLTLPSITAAQNGELYWGYDAAQYAASAGSTSGFTYTVTGLNNLIVYRPNLTVGTAYQATGTQATSGRSLSAGIIIAASTGPVLTTSGAATFGGLTSTSAFQIQNANSASIFNANTTNGGSIVITNSPTNPTQVNEADANATASGLTSTLTYSAKWAGDLVTVGIRESSSGGPAVSSISGGGVTTWQKVTSMTNSTDGVRVELWQGTVTSAPGSGSIVVSFATSPGVNVEVAANEFTATAGASSSTTWSVIASNSIHDTGTTSPAFPSLTSTQNDQLYWGYLFAINTGSTGSGTSSANNGFDFGTTARNNIIAFNPNLAANTAYQPTGTQTSSGSNDADAVGMIVQANVGNALTINGSQGINGAATVADANSTTAFQVQGSGGAGVLTVDTLDSAIVLGNDGTPQSNVTVRGGSASGANASGGNITFQASNGTGSGGSGSIIFQTGTPSGSTIGVDNSATASTTTTNMTLSYTTGAESNMVMVVQTTNGSGNSISSLSYNGTALTQLTTGNTTGSGAHEEIWYMVAPPSGTHNLVANLVGANGTLGVSTFYNVNQTTPFGTFASASGTTTGTQSTNLSVTATSSSQIVYDALSQDSSNCALGGPGTGQTALTLYNLCSGLYDAGTSYKAGTNGTVSMSWSVVSADWIDIGFPINAVANTNSDSLNNSFTLANTGAATFQNGVNSASALQVQNATSGSNFNVSTTTTVLNENMVSTQPIGIFNGGSSWSSGNYVELDSGGPGNDGEVAYNLNNVGTNWDAKFSFWDNSTNAGDGTFFFASDNTIPASFHLGSTYGGGAYEFAYDEITSKVEIDWNGTAIATSTGTYTFDNSTWDTAEIVKTGNTFNMYLNGSLALSYTDSSRTLTGTYFGVGGCSCSNAGEHRAKGLTLTTDQVGAQVSTIQANALDTTASGSTLTLGGINTGSVNLGGQNTSTITIGQGYAAGTVLVLGKDTNGGTPTEVDGGVYYDTTLNAFRCGQSSEWVNCVSFVQTHNLSNQGSAGTLSTANTWTNYPGTSSLTFTKQAAQTKLLVTIQTSFRTGTAATVVELGFKIGSTTYTCTKTVLNTASAHTPMSCSYLVTGLAAGSTTVQVQWEDLTGSTTLTYDTNDWLSVTAQETD